MKSARTAWREDKTNSKLKKVYKKWKKELASAKEKKARMGSEKVAGEKANSGKKGSESRASKNSMKSRKRKNRNQTNDEGAPPSKRKESSLKISTNKSPSARITHTSENKQTSQENSKLKVFVSNLNFKIDENGIRKMFDKCGKITEVTWLEDKEEDGFKKFQGCAYVTFSDQEGARRATERKEFRHMGRDVRVEYSRDKTAPMSTVQEGAVSCFVGNIPFDTKAENLKDWTGGREAGVKKVYIPKDKKTGNKKGYAFVEFESTEKLRSFLTKNGNNFLGRRVRLRPKPPKTRR